MLENFSLETFSLVDTLTRGFKKVSSMETLDPAASRVVPVLRLVKDNELLWRKFHSVGTEMVVTGRGRCLFPSIVVTLHGLDPERSYTLMVDMESISDQRYTYMQEQGWCPSAPAPQQQSSGVYIHADTPALGAELNEKAVSFKMLKICTANGIGKKGMIPLTRMHKYRPRIHLIQNAEELKSKHCSWTYCFPETEFIAVGHYHSKKMKKMKIEYNPYAKGALPRSRRQKTPQSVIVEGVDCENRRSSSIMLACLQRTQNPPSQHLSCPSKTLESMKYPKMALPTIPSRWSSRNRVLEQQIIRQRDQEERLRRQWEMHRQYFKNQDVRSNKQAQWSSRQSFQKSMTAYHQNRQQQEKLCNLEQRRKKLQRLLQEEQDLLEAELRELKVDTRSVIEDAKEKTEELKSAREDRRRKVAEQLLYEHWKKNNIELRKIESELHKMHVTGSWSSQITEKQQKEEAEMEEKKRLENEYEIARRQAIERMKQEEERRRQEDLKQAEILRQQMEELRLREIEAKNLKAEQEKLLKQRWELENLEEERKQLEQRRKKSELGRILNRQYKTQMRRRAQQIQEELEMDRRFLASLIEKDEADQQLQSARREQAVANAAWMKKVIEEQLQLEREREAELDTIFREEAQRMWQKREEEWERERQARMRLMQEVLVGRQQQVLERLDMNRRAQEESVQRREDLIRELEELKETTKREKEEEEELKTARKQELAAQVEERRRQELEELQRQQEEKNDERLVERQEEEMFQHEAKLMRQRGYEPKMFHRPRIAWT
ncbi:trichoplein keratin filament-binding protein isoform X1 [Stegostoma tigrinum]|uniref:trichoplein keratin filament-binding protein isoform X1 n=3 Tax=Stegostoma tigrinum TaxID=3053191 RepID=UPI00286FE04C|nr:trichoplein keratin filament-binding protein isoform X1 [Stegostoma tigrinum]